MITNIHALSYQQYSSAMFGQKGELFGHLGQALRSSQIGQTWQRSTAGNSSHVY